jgi:DegV family protein with EDD domain
MVLKVVTDGTVDMPLEWQSIYQIDVLPFRIRIGEKNYTQGIDINQESFYRLVRENKTVPKTTLLTPNEIISYYRKIAGKGDEILSIHVSSKMSGTFASAFTAAQEVAHEFKVYPFDSYAGSAGLGFMCREARLMSMNGSPIQDILKRLDEIRKQLVIVLTLDTLEFAYMNGRVNALQSAITSLLKIKPIVILQEGILQMGDRVRTRQRSLDNVINQVIVSFGKQPLNVAVVHAADKDAATTLSNMVKSTLNCNEIFILDLSISVAANLGPGTVGIAAYPSA